ncbi:hypothetical protein OROHE_006194 [Orobanche hederae]
MFICGSGSFNHQDEDETESNGSPCPTPKRSKRNTSFCKIIGKDNNSNKNPYANRGLDKFYSLLADLDDKKQKIYRRMGAEEISFVRFVYTNDSNHVKPIVVKVKEKKQEKNSTDLINKSIKNSASNINPTNVEVTDETSVTPLAEEELNKKSRRKKRCLRCKGSLKLDNLKQSYFYFPVILVLILSFLAIYGRTFAILCTSIGWYMVPTVIGGSSSSSSSSSPNERELKRKKEYLRKQSYAKINVQSEGHPSLKSVINGLIDNNK